MLMIGIHTTRPVCSFNKNVQKKPTRLTHQIGPMSHSSAACTSLMIRGRGTTLTRSSFSLPLSLSPSPHSLHCLLSTTLQTMHAYFDQKVPPARVHRQTRPTNYVMFPRPAQSKRYTRRHAHITGTKRNVIL